MILHRLVHHLPFFLRVAHLLEDVDLRDEVERELVRNVSRRARSRRARGGRASGPSVRRRRPCPRRTPTGRWRRRRGGYGARSWIGLRTTTIWMVEQFGLAMMPWCQARSCGFTSGTTSGQSGCMRHAELLSMTTAPWRTASGASSRLASPPAEKMAMSTPAKCAASATSQADRRHRGTSPACPRRSATSSGRRSRDREPARLERPDHLAADHPDGADDGDVPAAVVHPGLPGGRSVPRPIGS